VKELDLRKTKVKKKFNISVFIKERHNVVIAMKSSDSSGQCANSKDCKN